LILSASGVRFSRRGTMASDHVFTVTVSLPQLTTNSHLARSNAVSLGAKVN